MNDQTRHSQAPTEAKSCEDAHPICHVFNSLKNSVFDIWVSANIFDPKTLPATLWR
jgi:hypothetical protein